MKDNYNEMINGNIKKLLIKLAIPTIISMLVSSIYNLVDAYFVTKINDSASAAISVVFSLQTLIQAIGFTIGMGTGSLLSIALGKNDKDQANKYGSSACFLGILLGLLLALFGLIFQEGFMELLGATPTSLPYAIDYSKYILLATPIMILSFILNNILRSEGKAIFSMIGIGFGSLINIGLDPLLINKFNMGINGAGLATAISQLTSFIILLSFFLIGKSTTKLKFKSISLKIKTYGQILLTGSPTLFRQGCATIANICLNSLGGNYSDAVVAALGITSKIYIFIRNIVLGIGQGYMPILGFNYGAKKIDRIKKAFAYALIGQTVVCLVAFLIVLLIPNILIKAFADNDENIIYWGTKSIKLLAIGLPLLGFSTIINQSLQVSKHSVSATFLASLRQGIIYVPLIFILNNSYKEIGLCLTQPISDLLTALISIPFFIYFFKALNKLKENV